MPEKTLRKTTALPIITAGIVMAAAVRLPCAFVCALYSALKAANSRLCSSCVFCKRRGGGRGGGEGQGP